MADKLLEKCTGEITNLFWDRIKNRLENKIDDFWNNNILKNKNLFNKYLRKTYYNIGQIKTLLNRQDPKFLKSFCIDADLMLNNQKIQTDKLCNILEIGSKIIITGIGGMGKTILLKSLYLKCIEEGELIPIYCSLRDFNNYSESEINLEKSIYDWLKSNELNIDYSLYKECLNRGAFLILLDGYDELNSNISKIVGKQVREFANEYCHNYFILSSRPLDDFIGWSYFVELQTRNLNKKQALALIEGIDYDPKIQKAFIEQLDKNLFDEYECLAGNPLLLTIMLLVFEENSTLPDNLNDFYEQAFHVLFEKHDSSKGLYKRVVKSNLNYSDFKNVFSHFCFYTFFIEKYDFDKHEIYNILNEIKGSSKVSFNIECFTDDMIDNVCMLVKDGVKYKFIHRSFQEFFAAYYTTLCSDEEQCKLFEQLDSTVLDNVFNRTRYFEMLNMIQPKRFYDNVIVNFTRKIYYSLKNVNFKNKEMIDIMFDNTVLLYGKNRFGIRQANENKVFVYCQIIYDFFYEQSIIYKIFDFICKNREADDNIRFYSLSSVICNIDQPLFDDFFEKIKEVYSKSQAKEQTHDIKILLKNL